MNPFSNGLIFGFGVTLSVALFLLSSGEVQAAVYKCVDGSGKVSYQDSPCRFDSGGEVQIKKSPVGMSTEDQAWVTEHKPMLASMCMRSLTTSTAQQSLTPDESRKICECGINRYFSNPIGKLRDLYDRRDIEGNQRLFRPAMTSCAKEVIDNRPYGK